MNLTISASLVQFLARSKLEIHTFQKLTSGMVLSTSAQKTLMFKARNGISSSLTLKKITPITMLHSGQLNFSLSLIPTAPSVLTPF